MYLRIRGDLFSRRLVREIEDITNCGDVCFRAVEHNREKRMVTIPILRCNIAKAFGGFFHGYHRKVKIPALIVVREVVTCEIENKLENIDTTTVSMLFGLHVDIMHKRISIASAEEARQGGHAYVIELKVSEIDIEISDQDETGK